MKRWFPLFGLAGLVVTPWSVARAETLAMEAAQDEDQEGIYVKHDEDDWDGSKRYSFGIGYGVVDLDGDPFSNTEPYFSAAFRMRFSRAQSRRMQGYLEPEIGYWEADSRRGTAEDLLVGINVIAALPLGAVDFFIGTGVGLHFLDVEIRDRGVRVSQSNELFGINAQFGFEVPVSRKVGLFAVGRVDDVEKRDTLEVKAYGGVRFYF